MSDVSSQFHSNGESAEEGNRSEGMCVPTVNGDGMCHTRGTCTSITSGTGHVRNLQIAGYFIPSLTQV